MVHLKSQMFRNNKSSNHSAHAHQEVCSITWTYFIVCLGQRRVSVIKTPLCPRWTTAVTTPDCLICIRIQTYRRALSKQLGTSDSALNQGNSSSEKQNIFNYNEGSSTVHVAEPVSCVETFKTWPESPKTFWKIILNKLNIWWTIFKGLKQIHLTEMNVRNNKKSCA